MPHAVLQQVILIAALQHAERATQDRRRPPASRREREGDLEIDEVGCTRVVDKDVLPFVQIDMSDPSAVHLGEHVTQSREKIIRDPFALSQWMTGDEFV